MQTIPIEIRSGSQTIPLTTEQARVIEAVSPTVDLERTTGGVVITVEDVHGSRSETVYDGLKGDPGDPGQSPTATIVETENGAVISVTDAEGTTTANIRNGQDGAPGAPGAPGTPGNDGVSPTISVTDITGGHRVTITDATGAHSFDVMDGESGQGAVQDVQVNDVSVLQDGVANVPVANENNRTLGVVYPGGKVYGLTMSSAYPGMLYVYSAEATDVKAASNYYKPIVPGRQDASTFYGLAKAAGDTTQRQSSNAVGMYTESAKSAISEMLNGSVSVSGTAPTINALPGIRYICGEVTTIDITTPASGIIDVVFTSGSTPAVLTVTPPSGMTMRWANGFDPDNLEANTTYEINIADGCLGVAGTWT